MLAQLLISLPLAAISIFGMSIFLNRSIKESTRMEAQMSLDLAHGQALHEIQGFESLKNFTSLQGVLNSPGMMACIQGVGNNCTSFSSNPDKTITSLNNRQVLNGAKSKSGSTNCSITTPSGCPFQQSAIAEWQCEARRCSSLMITLTTQDTSATATRHGQRVTKVLLPARALFARADLASCPPGRFLVGFQYYNSEPICDVIPGYSDPNNELPARNISAASQTDVSRDPGQSNCTDGFVRSGLFESQSQCYGRQGSFSPNPTAVAAPTIPGPVPKPYVEPPPPLPPPCPVGWTRNAWGTCTSPYSGGGEGPGGDCTNCGGNGAEGSNAGDAGRGGEGGEGGS